MWWHIPLWPFKKIDDWLRRHYEKKQIQEQIALQQKEYLLKIIPALDVSAHLIRNPDPPRRSDIPMIDIVVRNYGGRTKIFHGRFWFSLSDNPGYKEEKHLSDVEMPNGKEEKFFLLIIRQHYEKVIAGYSILKFHYDLVFENQIGQPEERNGTRTYDPGKETFVSNP